jgi:diguanylate cyclase (GGDEF)-like protein
MNIKELLKKLESVEDEELKQMVFDLLRDRERLMSETMRDELTGVYNRRVLDNIKCFGSVAMCDLDDFKSVNDTYGHEMGDRVLKAFSKALLSCVRNDDIVCRFGGDEFVVFFVACAPELVKKRLEDLVIKLKKNNIYFSAGISTYNCNNTLNDAIDEADSALYESKEKGKNQVSIYKKKSLVLKK